MGAVAALLELLDFLLCCCGVNGEVKFLRAVATTLTHPVALRFVLTPPLPKTHPPAAPTGGYTTGRADLIALLRQRARPYLFSNTLAPAVAGASLAVFELLSGSTVLRDRLEANTAYFRERMTAAGFDIRPGSHPIVPIMLGDAALATNMAAKMLERGIYVVSFCFA